MVVPLNWKEKHSQNVHTIHFTTMILDLLCNCKSINAVLYLKDYRLGLKLSYALVSVNFSTGTVILKGQFWTGKTNHNDPCTSAKGIQFWKLKISSKNE